MASITFQVNTDKSITSSEFNAASSRQKSLSNASSLLSGLASGSVNGKVDVHYNATNGVAAAATITITHANVTNNDTTTICNTVITAATSGNGTTSWTIGADATADATALKNCINANTTLNKIVVATSAAGVVTITSVVKGLIGNGLALATSDATAFALVAFTGGTGGSSGSPTSY
jgi:phage tail sheath gpL-like